MTKLLLRNKDGIYSSVRSLKEGVDKDAFQVKMKTKGYDVVWLRGNPPTMQKLEQWVGNGVAKTPCGCRVEPDGECPHGNHSWLIVLGLI